MTWTVKYTAQAVKQLKKLDKAQRQRIYKYIDERLLTEDHPRTVGKQLKGILSKYWSYRVGDYRLLAVIEDNELIIVMAEIAHRRHVYK